jgi:lactate permease
VNTEAPPIDVLHWAIADLPLLVLLLLLVVLRWKAPEAAPIGLLVAAVASLLFYRTPLDTLAVASGKGVWDAVFILYVIWPALLLYRVVDRAGAFVALREGIERFSNNELFLVLAFGWVFASFLQGITGFGAPIAIVAPLLLALDVRPLYAVVIPLIGHAWANLFGTLAVAWLATQQVIDLQQPAATAWQTAALLVIPNLLAGVGIAWLFGRWRAVMHGAPLIAIIALVQSGGQFGLALWNPVLAGFVASTMALVALYPLSRWKRYAERAEGITERPAMREPLEAAEQQRAEHQAAEPKPVMGLTMALAPYVVLTVLTVGALIIPPMERTLEGIEVGPPFPSVSTGYDLERPAEEQYAPFAPLTHPGTFLLLASLLSWLIYRSRGYYRAWRLEAGSEEVGGGLWQTVASDAAPASIAVVTLLSMSRIMDHSGQTLVLAGGIAETAPPLVFAFFASWIGLLGSFMTSSNTASNILFAPLQQSVAQAEALSEATIISAQHTGAAVGNAIAPANVVLGTGTAGIVGREGDVLRTVLPWALGVTAIVGIATILLVVL